MEKGHQGEVFRKHDQHGRRVDEDHGHHQLSDAQRESGAASSERICAGDAGRRVGRGADRRCDLGNHTVVKYEHMGRQHRHAQLRQRRLGNGNQHDVERRRRQAGAHQDARDGDKDQRQELLHGGLREYVERNPADYRV